MINSFLKLYQEKLFLDSEIHCSDGTEACHFIISTKLLSFNSLREFSSPLDYRFVYPILPKKR